MLNLVRYTPEYFDRWNRFVEESNNGTIFHRLDFLQYHGNRFATGEHHLLWLKGEAIFAVLPFLVMDENGRKIGKSPYGASFGGVVYNKKFRFRHALEIVESLQKYFREIHLDEVTLTTTPGFYSVSPSNYFEYALSRAGFRLHSRDVFNAVRLGKDYTETWNNFEGRARTAIRKAKENFDVNLNVSPTEFYHILLEDKARHNNAKPTHTLNELVFLKESFPGKIFFDVAVLKKNQAKAGICYFLCNPQVMMTFYMAQENNALRADGINVLVEHGIKRALQMKVSYLDFGGSTLGYTIENIGVCEFKEGFGAHGFFRDTFKYNSSVIPNSVN